MWKMIVMKIMAILMKNNENDNEMIMNINNMAMKMAKIINEKANENNSNNNNVWKYENILK